jgi:hypothetical protein
MASCCGAFSILPQVTVFFKQKIVTTKIKTKGKVQSDEVTKRAN